DFLNAEIQRLLGETSTSIIPNRTNNLRMSRMAKIEFPMFYGNDPTGWVYTCNQFFKVDVVEDDHKNIRQKGGTVQIYIDAFDLLMTKVQIYIDAFDLKH
ncbi:hypothetical protein Tco_0081758, partial [Tanacetum coccineum]